MNSLPVNTFKQALIANRRQVGLWVTFAHQQIAEVVACSGFDWLLFDMEHSPTDLYDVGQQLLAVRGTPTAAVVRVPILDMGWIKRVLDAGAPNIMVPNIRSVQEAREAVSWTRFAPQGLRGVASSTRAGGWLRSRPPLQWRSRRDGGGCRLGAADQRRAGRAHPCDRTRRS